MAIELVFQKYDDLMGDGYARGIPGDSLLMRVRYRTAASIGKFADMNSLNSRTCVAHFTNTGSKPIRNYLQFCEEAIKRYKPQKPDFINVMPFEVETDVMPLVIELADQEDIMV